MNRHLSRAALIAALSMPATTALATGWPSVPFPEDARAELVSSDMLFNGLPMRSVRFESEQDVSDIIEFYRNAWGEQIVINDVAGKKVVGHLQDRHYITVELSPVGGGTRATIGMMDITAEAPKSVPGEWFPQPANTDVLSAIQQLDLPGEPRTLMLQNDLSPSQNYLFLRRKLVASNWAASGPGCSMVANSCVVRFEKAQQHMTITLDREQEGTVIVVNEAGD